MKQLILLRHAQAADKIPEYQDISRPLTAKGEKQAAEAGEKIQKAGLIPQHIFCSPSERTLRTAHTVSGLLGTHLPVEIQPTLYLATAADILTFLETCSENTSCILLVGHNPGITECAALLAKQTIRDLEPAQICCLQWADDYSWEDIANGAAANVQVLNV